MFLTVRPDLPAARRNRRHRLPHHPSSVFCLAVVLARANPPVLCARAPGGGGKGRRRQGEDEEGGSETREQGERREEGEGRKEGRREGGKKGVRASNMHNAKHCAVSPTSHLSGPAAPANCRREGGVKRNARAKTPDDRLARVGSGPPRRRR